MRRPDLSRVARALMDDCPRFEVRPGHVERVDDGTAAAEVVVGGRTFRALWAFDSVSVPPRDPPVDARLAFTGWEVQCARPAFDPTAPTLFDFRTAQAGGARFLYVLPTDPYRALVEVTEFVPRRARPPAPEARDAALAEYLTEVLHSGDHTVLRRESALLPLRTRFSPRAGRRVLAIGARGGLVKASTGYAYGRVQRDSRAVAASLVHHGHPFATRPPRRRHRLLDAVLLEVLDRDPRQLERAFARLFFGTSAERVLRFLDEDTGVREELRLIASLPPLPYLRALAARATVR